MNTEDLVNVLVPRRHLSQVYGFIANLEGAGGGTAHPITDQGEAPEAETTKNTAVPSNGRSLDEWTSSRLRKMVDQSPPAMIDILSALADRPGEWLSTHDLAASIKDNPDANWNTVAGTLGAFGRRVKNRYGLETWPIDDRHDHDTKGHVYRMSEDIARLIKQFVAERNS